MKRWGWIAAMAFAAAGLTAQTLDQPVATIKLDKKTSVVSQKDFREQASAAEQQKRAPLTDDEKSKLLDAMVSNELIHMDMDNLGIKATDDDLLKQFRVNNPGLTDTQIRAEVEKRSGKSWDDAVAPLKKQVALGKYFGQLPGAGDVGKITVTDDEIKAYYDANSSSLVSPTMLRMSYIFFDTKTKPKGTLAEIQKRAEDTLQKIRSQQSTFEEMAATVSDDPVSAKRNGDFGYIPRTTETPQGQQALAFFGQDFLDKIFALKKGEVSDVLTSNQGLNIVRITQKSDKHFMTLDEAVSPDQSQTVRDYIKQGLLQRKTNAAEQKILSDAADGLRKKATIKTYENNF